MTTTPTERRLAITPGTNIRWEPCYEMPDGEYNWALVSDESNRTGRVLNPNTVLLLTGDCRTGEGKPIGEHPDLVLYADAHNTYNACGLTPSELLAELTKLRSERDELVGALREAILELDKCERACKRAYTIADHHSILDLRAVPNQLKVRAFRDMLAKHNPE